MAEFKIKGIEKEKIFTKLWCKNYSLVIIGSIIIALGYVFFIVPHKIVPGGVFGLSILINQLTGYPIGVIAICINIPLLLLGMRIIGKEFGVKTLLALLLGSGFIDGLMYLFPTPIVTSDILVSALFGGGSIGFGIALVVKAGATTGGTDVIARILSKNVDFPIGKTLVVVDGVIVLLAIFVFKDFDLASYCIIAIVAISMTIDFVLNGLNNKKLIMIVSERHSEIRQFILDSDFGGTYLTGKGLFYPGNEKQIIISVIDRKGISDIRRFIKKVDPNAFVALTNTTDIIGNGFNLE